MHGAGADMHMCTLGSRQTTVHDGPCAQELLVAAAERTLKLRGDQSAGTVRHATCSDHGAHKCKCCKARCRGSQPP